MQQVSKSALRAVKNLTCSVVESTARDVTSNSTANASPEDLSMLASWCHNESDCKEILLVLDKRLNDTGKNWRHVFKSLVLCETLFRNGSFDVVCYFRDNIYLIKTLKEFQHTDENGVDVGIIVREKATALTSLLIDKERLKRERGGSARDSRLLSRHVEDPTPTHARNRSMSQPLPRPSPAESARKRREAQLEKDKRELADAMAASKEDEAKRQRLLRSQAGDGVFNDLRQSKDDSLVSVAESASVPAAIDPMQQLYEEQLRQAAMQQQAAQQQQALYAQSLFAAQQHAQQQAQQEAALQQAAAFQQQQAFEQYQLQQQQQYLAQQQQLHQQQYYQPAPPAVQPTGVNNPFAAFSSPSPAAPLPSFTSYTAPSPAPSSSFESPPTPETRPRANTTSAVGVRPPPELERLIALGQGVDTFGNEGEMRVARGTLFSSYGNGGAGH